nr:Wzz/FepE/Etk N-terminal domain-containing protein [Variovorax boronicumulans]
MAPDDDSARSVHAPVFQAYGAGAPMVGGVPAQRSAAMRRRLLVFSSVFVLAALCSLLYTFLRPAVYLADARVQLTPSFLGASVAASAPRDASQDFLTELQNLVSRPVLEKVARRLDAGQAPDDALDARVQSLQEMVRVQPVDGTNVVRIEARGPDRRGVARVVNTLVEVYRDEQSAQGDRAVEQQLVQARETVREMDERVRARQRAVEAFRTDAAIVSGERAENQTLARLKGLGDAVAKNDERAAAAAGRVRALEEAVAQGRRAPLARDNPTVASIETRLSQMREEYKTLERQFTPHYLDMDPSARAVRNRIADLEQQLDSERRKSAQDALAEAREELAGARATAQRLQQQFGEDRQKAQDFTRRFAEFEAMREELKSMEQVRQGAHQRLLALEATAGERQPRLVVVEPATAPQTAWRPLYARDAAMSIGASLLLGLLAVWFVEFFHRAEAVVPGPSTVIVSQPWIRPHPTDAVLGHAPASGALPHAASASHHPLATPLLAQALPRELQQHEVGQLLGAAAPEHLPLLVCLLCGLSAEEAGALRVGDLDAGAARLTVPGDAPRVLALSEPLLALLVASAGAGAPPQQPLLSASGQALAAPDVASVVTLSAYDAGLEQPQSVTPESLRHTYVAFLVRQGLRFAELGRLVGRLSSEQLHALGSLAPPGERRPLAEIETLMPAVVALR